MQTITTSQTVVPTPWRNGGDTNPELPGLPSNDIQAYSRPAETNTTTWTALAAFWGSQPSGEHLLVIIDEYSRYPEVELVRSTSAQAVIPHLDRVFSTHGYQRRWRRIPETVKADGGPPFNGHKYHQDMQWAGIRTIAVSPEDPEANGLAEDFMKAMNKIWHIAHIEHKTTQHQDRRPGAVDYFSPIQDTTQIPTKSLPSREPKLQQQEDLLKYENKTSNDSRSSPIQYVLSKCTIPTESTQRWHIHLWQHHSSTPTYPSNPTYTSTPTYSATTTPTWSHTPASSTTQVQYPNGHLDPNINSNLPREHRNRNPPKSYNPHKGLWT